MISEARVKELAQERINELDTDLFIVEINIDPANRIFIEMDHRNRGVSIDECVSVSRNVEHNLDRDEEDFELQVSSPGLGKPFKVWEQYPKNIGKTVKIRTTEGEELKGVLKAAEEGKIMVETSRKEKVEGKKKKQTVFEERVFGLEEIKETKLVISFN